MKKTVIAGTALTGLALAGGFAGMVSAQSVAEATNLTEEQVIEIALLEINGDIEEVELETRRGKSIYEVEIITEDGTEGEVKIDAATGDVLKVEFEDDDRSKRGHDCDEDDEDTDDIEGEDA